MSAAVAAIACDHPEVAALLLAHGADVGQVDHDTMEMASSAMRAVLAGLAPPPAAGGDRGDTAGAGAGADADAEAPSASPVADDA